MRVHDLHRELRGLQRRLGTGSERPDDFIEILRLAHELNNALTVAAFASDPPEQEAKPGLWLLRWWRAEISRHRAKS